MIKMKKETMIYILLMILIIWNYFIDLYFNIKMVKLEIQIYCIFFWTLNTDFELLIKQEPEINYRKKIINSNSSLLCYFFCWKKKQNNHEVDD